MIWTIYWDSSTQTTMIIFLMLTSICFRIYQWSPYSNLYTEFNVLFHKYGGMNVAVKNSMSHFSMFVPTNATVKFANVNMVHSQGIGIILCHFTNCPIIYPVVPVYYCLGHGIYIQLNLYLCTTDVHVSPLPAPQEIIGTGTRSLRICSNQVHLREISQFPLSSDPVWKITTKIWALFGYMEAGLIKIERLNITIHTSKIMLVCMENSGQNFPS